MDFGKLVFRPFVFLLVFFSFFNSYNNVSHFLAFEKSGNTIAKLAWSNRIDCEQSIPKRKKTGGR